MQGGPSQTKDLPTSRWILFLGRKEPTGIHSVLRYILKDTAIGLPELITTTEDAYESLAIDLATNPDRLLAIKTKLAANRLTTPLFDSETYTRHLENAYLQMYERYMADLPPDHIFVR